MMASQIFDIILFYTRHSNLSSSINRYRQLNCTTLISIIHPLNSLFAIGSRSLPTLETLIVVLLKLTIKKARTSEMRKFKCITIYDTNKPQCTCTSIFLCHLLQLQHQQHMYLKIEKATKHKHEKLIRKNYN